MTAVIDQAADRGLFICQSQSMNLWMEDPSYAKLTKMHLYAWNKGLKTGMYYLRRQARAAAQQFTIQPEQPDDNEAVINTTTVPSPSPSSPKDEECLMCSA